MTCRAARTSRKSRSIARWWRGRSSRSFGRSRTKTRRKGGDFRFKERRFTNRRFLLRSAVCKPPLLDDVWTVMRVVVLNTGTELLLGDVVNTHINFIAREIFPLGLRVSWQIAVPDGAPIRDALAESLDSDIVFVTGGLGP